MRVHLLLEKETIIHIQIADFNYVTKWMNEGRGVKKGEHRSTVEA